MCTKKTKLVELPPWALPLQQAVANIVLENESVAQVHRNWNQILHNYALVAKGNLPGVSERMGSGACK